MSNALNRRNFLERIPLIAGAFVAGMKSPALAAEPALEKGSFNVRRFGAKGNGQVRDTEAVQRAIDAAGREGGCVYFPPGRYLCGTVRLRSHVTIHLENGATLAAAPERSDFDDYEKLL
jgi:polygalacturonase